MRYKALTLRGALKASAFLAGIIGAISLGTVGSVQATAIGLELGPSPHITWKVMDSFTELDGIALHGQTLSLDFTFSKGEFARLFTVTSDSFVGLLKLQTNGSRSVGFLDGTGFLVDRHGHPMQQPQQLGSASGNNGSLAAGLFPLLPGDLQGPLDFFGIHFDLTLPLDRSVSITGEEFMLMSHFNQPFGVGPGVPKDIVPDSGSTLLLFSIANFGLFAFRQIRRPI
jgi:hypothetical protein